MIKNTTDPDDILLSAYLDGALDAEERRVLEHRLTTDAMLAERLHVLRQSEQAFREEIASIDGAPMSEDLSSLLDQLADKNDEENPTVVAFPLWRGTARALETHRAIAASLAVLGAALLFQMVARPGAPSAWPDDGLIAPSSEIAGLLNTRPSGGAATLADGRQVAFRLSYRSKNGALCRAFALSGAAGEHMENVACKERQNWRLAFSALSKSGGQTPQGVYNAASSPEAMAVLDAYLDRDIDGDPLTREDETAAAARQWRAVADE